MPQTIKISGDYAVENSSYLIRLDAYDEEGQPVVPKTGVWSLTDGSGNVINSLDQVVISPLASTMYVLLTDDDLAPAYFGIQTVAHDVTQLLRNLAGKVGGTSCGDQ